MKTPISLPFSSRRAKFLISFSAMKEAILAVLPDSKDDAKSLKEIANEMGLWWPWSEGREKKATSFGIMPTGRPIRQSRRASASASAGGEWSWRTSGPGCERGDRLRGARAPHGRDPGGTGESYVSIPVGFSSALQLHSGIALISA